MLTYIHTILHNTYTKTSLYHRFALLRAFCETVTYSGHHGEDKDVCDVLAEFLRGKGENDDVIQAMTAWGSEFWRDLLQSNIEETVSTLYRSLERLPVVVMYVPVALPSERIQEIALWLRKHTGKHVIIDMRVSPSIDVGCAFSIGDTYYDYTYRRRMADAHKQIISMMGEYSDNAAAQA